MLFRSPRLSAYRWNENNPIIVVLGGDKPIDHQKNKGADRPKDIKDIDEHKFNKEHQQKNILWLSSALYPNPEAVLRKLHENTIQSVLIEGGPETLQRFIDSNLWDECYCYKSANSWDNGLKGPKLNASLTPIATFEDNVLFYGQNPL